MKAESDPKFNVYGDLYCNLGAWDGETNLCSLAIVREKKCRGLDLVRCSKRVRFKES